MLRTLLRGARHVDCRPETAGSQEKNRGTAKGMSLLWVGDLPALGTRKETGKRHAGKERQGTSISLLCLPENLLHYPEGTTQADQMEAPFDVNTTSHDMHCVK